MSNIFPYLTDAQKKAVTTYVRLFPGITCLAIPESTIRSSEKKRKLPDAAPFDCIIVGATTYDLIIES